jgi:L-lactate dehydrogenase complex protein LldG
MLQEQHGRDMLVDSSNLTLISGPSRTGDIELTLTLGVHGPREIHVVLID